MVGYALIVIFHYLTLQEKKVSDLKTILMTDKVFFLAYIHRIISIAGKPHLKHIHFEQYTHAYLAMFLPVYLTCRKLTSRVDSNCVLRKPSCYILRHKSFQSIHHI